MITKPAKDCKGQYLDQGEIVLDDYVLITLVDVTSIATNGEAGGGEIGKMIELPDITAPSDRIVTGKLSCDFPIGFFHRLAQRVSLADIGWLPVISKLSLLMQRVLALHLQRVHSYRVTV